MPGRSPEIGNGNPTPVLLPGKSHGQRSLVGYSPQGRKRVRHNESTKQQQYSWSHLSPLESLPLSTVWKVESESESHSGVSDSFQGQNTGVGTLSLLQGIFPIQGSNPGLPHCRRLLYQLRHKGSPLKSWSSIKFTCTIKIVSHQILPTFKYRLRSSFLRTSPDQSHFLGLSSTVLPTATKKPTPSNQTLWTLGI